MKVVLLISYSPMKKKIRMIRMIFDIEIDFESQMAPFDTFPHYTNSKNSIISLGYVDSYAKIFIILYPPLENSTTRNAIGHNLLPLFEIGITDLAHPAHLSPTSLYLDNLLRYTILQGLMEFYLI